jgi:diadenosine tetraphosphate (Ap4A) HIT family hydrolase
VRVVQKAEAMALLALYREPHATAPCLPCALLSRAPSAMEVLSENEHAIAVLNRFAQRRGHVIVWLKRHQEHVHELEWLVYAAVQRLTYEASIALKLALSPVRVYSALLGSTQPLPISYPHLHVHVIPVFDTDERSRPARVFSWSEGIVMYEDAEALELAALLRAHWPRERGGARQ